MRNPSILAAVMAGMFALACDESTDPGPETFSATLTPGAEAPPVTNAPNASGTATFTLQGTSMQFTINVSGLSGNPNGAHIHGPAAVGVATGVIVPFSPLAATTSGQLVTGSFTASSVSTVSFDSVLVLMRNGNAYVNVHTALNPGGEIRGQIVRP